jgi:hypothetical protein
MDRSSRRRLGDVDQFVGSGRPVGKGLANRGLDLVRIKAADHVDPGAGGAEVVGVETMHVIHAECPQTLFGREEPAVRVVAV